MYYLDFKKKIIIVLGLIIIVLFVGGVYNFKKEFNNQQQNGVVSSQKTPDPGVNQNDEPKIISTAPFPLDQITILPTQVIEINFNRSLQNEPETKVVIEPKMEIKKELINNRKTLKISPVRSYILGNGYTLFIKGETKFDGNKTLGHDEIFHFKTLDYSGV